MLCHEMLLRPDTGKTNTNLDSREFSLFFSLDPTTLAERFGHIQLEGWILARVSQQIIYGLPM